MLFRYIAKFAGCHEAIVKTVEMLEYVAFGMLAAFADSAVKFLLEFTVHAAWLATNLYWLYNSSNDLLFEKTGVTHKDIVVVCIAITFIVKAIKYTRSTVFHLLYLFESRRTGYIAPPVVFSASALFPTDVVLEAANAHNVIALSCDGTVRPPMVFEVYRAITTGTSDTDTEVTQLSFQGHGFFLDNKAVTASHVVGPDDVVYVKTPSQARTLPVKVVSYDISGFLDFVHLEAKALQAMLGLKSYKSAFPKPGPVTVFTRTNGGFISQHVQPLKAKPGARSMFLETRTNTNSGDSGLPVLQGGKVVALHHGADMKNKVNLHILLVQQCWANITRVVSKVADVTVTTESPNTQDSDGDERRQHILDYVEQRQLISQRASQGEYLYDDAVTKADRKKARMDALSLSLNGKKSWADMMDDDIELEKRIMLRLENAIDVALSKKQKLEDEQEENVPEPLDFQWGAKRVLAAPEQVVDMTKSVESTVQSDLVAKGALLSQLLSSLPEDQIIKSLQDSALSKRAFLRAWKVSGHPPQEVSQKSVPSTISKEHSKPAKKVTKGQSLTESPSSSTPKLKDCTKPEALQQTGAILSTNPESSS